MGTPDFSALFRFCTYILNAVVESIPSREHLNGTDKLELVTNVE